MVHKQSTNSDLESIEHVVFLGTYNANPFKDKIHNWLPKLDLTSTALVIADNASIDNSDVWLQELFSSLALPGRFVRNKHNFGGYGNLIVNLEMFPNARWVTTLHQDDFYMKEHIQKHRSVIQASDVNLGMVCSEAKSVDSSGNEIPFPRAIWLLENNLDPVSVFLSHLKQHAFPFSGASFSTEVLRRFSVPWHSTAFPDTELVMKMIAEYSVQFADGVTVKYFENPASESHSLSAEQRDLGVFNALFRVFAHPNFKKICNMVPVSKRSSFYESLTAGLKIRFENDVVGQMLAQAVLELFVEYVGLDEALAAHLALGYSKAGDHRALSQLGFFNSRVAELASNLVHSDSSEALEKTQEFKKDLFLFLLKLLPRGLRKKVFVVLMRTKFGRKKFPNWDFAWDRK